MNQLCSNCGKPAKIMYASDWYCLPCEDAVRYQEERMKQKSEDSIDFDDYENHGGE